MKLLDKKTASDLVKLVVFMRRHHPGDRRAGRADRQHHVLATRHEYKAEFIDATGVIKGDDVRIAGVKVGTVKGVEIVDRTRALVTFAVEDEAQVTQPATHATIRYRNLVGQRYISLAQRGRRQRRRAGRRRHHPGRPDLAGARPDGAVQRLQAAVPGAVAAATSTSSPTRSSRSSRARAAPLEGLLAHTASVTTTLAGPRPGHRRADRQPQRGARPRSATATSSLSRWSRTFQHLRRRPEGRPAGDPRLARLRSPRCRCRPPTWSRASASRSSTTSSSLRGVAGNLDQATRPSSTGRCRCCRSSSRRSAGPRSTAPGSTSTSASSTGQVTAAGRQVALPVDYNDQLATGVIAAVSEALPRAQPRDHRGDQPRRRRRC